MTSFFSCFILSSSCDHPEHILVWSWDCLPMILSWSWDDLEMILISRWSQDDLKMISRWSQDDLEMSLRWAWDEMLTKRRESTSTPAHEDGFPLSTVSWKKRDARWAGRLSAGRSASNQKREPMGKSQCLYFKRSSAHRASRWARLTIPLDSHGGENVTKSQLSFSATPKIRGRTTDLCGKSFFSTSYTGGAKLHKWDVNYLPEAKKR